MTTALPNHLTTEDCSAIQVLQHSTSALKANVFRMKCGDKAVVVKDYSHATPVFRHTLCRLLLKREMKVLERLQGLEGVPTLYGRYSRHGFIMRAVSGYNPDKKSLKGYDHVLQQLRDRVDTFHVQGVTHNDLRVCNMIVDEYGVLFIIDYASGFLHSPKRGSLAMLSSFLFTQLMLTDQAKVIRIMQHSRLYCTGER